MKNNSEFKYPPRTFYYGTQKYIFYQFFDDATLIMPQRKHKKSISSIDESTISID